MRIHYFQRYHSKENVATANTMLLLSRLYSYSPDKFFSFLKSEYLVNLTLGVSFTLQEKNVDSVLDATITQDSFKIAVETKLSDWFYEDQLLRHLNSFKDEKHKVLITLAPEPMEAGKKQAFENKLKEYNKEKGLSILHINTTFEIMTNAIKDLLDERDYEMQAVLDDYLDYCYNDKLILNSDSWKYMRVQLAGVTFDFNIRSNVYYDNADRGFRAHDFIGLYKSKSVRAIGKVVAIISAIETENGIEYKVKRGELTEERKHAILEAMDDGKSYGYELRKSEHNYFFVEKFFETDFRKDTPRAPMGSRIFDLTQILGTDTIPDDMGELAEILKGKTWR